jgi:hypothetical protein
MRALRAYSTVLLVVVVTAIVPTASEAARTDVLIMDNGDRITGEIVTLERGKMAFKTDNLGTLSVEWRHVAELRSSNSFTFETNTGAFYSGSLAEAQAHQLRLTSGERTVADLSVDSVVTIYRLEQAFWSRFDGSLDVGYSYTQQNASTQYNIDASARYTTDTRQVRVNFSSIFSTQEGATDTARNSLDGVLYRAMGQRWFYVGMASFAHNKGLDLDLRTLVGGGLARQLYQTNSGLFAVLGGLDYNREQYALNDEPVSSVEAVAGIEHAYYTFDGLNTQLTTRFVFLPSLTDAGRVRLELDSNLRQKIIGDLYWNLNLYETYDKRPPQPNARKNDFGITSSIGWSF